MAEVRKHKESADPISAAIRAAMGDPVKPTVPGVKSSPENEAPEEEQPKFQATSFNASNFTAFSWQSQAQSED